MIDKSLAHITLLVLLGVFSCGCQTWIFEHSIPIADRATPEWGSLKVYATDNVPFEYEEIGFVTISYHTNRYGEPNEKDMLSKFRDRALEMGADAVLNFRYEALGLYYLTHVSGVAVKIKRP